MTNAPPLGAPAGRQQNASRPFIQPCSGSPLSAPADRTSPVGRGNHNQRLGKHGPVHSKLSDAVRDYLADQPRFVFFAVNNCIHRGEFIDFRPFHSAASSNREQ